MKARDMAPFPEQERQLNSTSHLTGFVKKATKLIGPQEFCTSLFTWKHIIACLNCLPLILLTVKLTQ